MDHLAWFAAGGGGANSTPTPHPTRMWEVQKDPIPDGVKHESVIYVWLEQLRKNLTRKVVQGWWSFPASKSFYSPCINLFEFVDDLFAEVFHYLFSVGNFFMHDPLVAFFHFSFFYSICNYASEVMLAKINYWWPSDIFLQHLGGRVQP